MLVKFTGQDSLSEAGRVDPVRKFRLRPRRKPKLGNPPGAGSEPWDSAGMLECDRHWIFGSLPASARRIAGVRSIEP